jgi:hypothetical protein
MPTTLHFSVVRLKRPRANGFTEALLLKKIPDATSIVSIDVVTIATLPPGVYRRSVTKPALDRKLRRGTREEGKSL